MVTSRNYGEEAYHPMGRRLGTEDLPRLSKVSTD